MISPAAKSGTAPRAVGDGVGDGVREAIGVGVTLGDGGRDSEDRGAELSSGGRVHAVSSTAASPVVHRRMIPTAPA